MAVDMGEVRTSEVETAGKIRRKSKRVFRHRAEPVLIFAGKSEARNPKFETNAKDKTF